MEGIVCKDLFQHVFYLVLVVDWRVGCLVIFLEGFWVDKLSEDQVGSLGVLEFSEEIEIWVHLVYFAYTICYSLIKGFQDLIIALNHFEQII